MKFNTWPQENCWLIFHGIFPTISRYSLPFQVFKKMDFMWNRCTHLWMLSSVSVCRPLNRLSSSSIEGGLIKTNRGFKSVFLIWITPCVSWNINMEITKYTIIAWNLHFHEFFTLTMSRMQIFPCSTTVLTAALLVP